MLWPAPAASATPTLTPTSIPQASPPPPATTTRAPSPPPTSPTSTTTVPSTAVPPAGAALGLPCNASSAAKITCDINTSKDIVCMNEGPLMNSSSSRPEWSETPLSMTGVHATGTPGNPELGFWSGPTDGYLISCQPGQLGPTPGYWQHCGVRKRPEGYVC